MPPPETGHVGSNEATARGILFHWACQGSLHDHGLYTTWLQPRFTLLSWLKAVYDDTFDNTPDRRLDLGATVTDHTCVHENGSGDGNISLVVDDLFCSAQRRVPSKKWGRKESIFALVGALDDTQVTVWATGYAQPHLLSL